MIKVLLVEDHIKISQNIKTYLEDEFEVSFDFDLFDFEILKSISSLVDYIRSEQGE